MKEASESKKENASLEWAMKNVGKRENPGDALENVLKASESDVYPFSIYFSAE